MNKPKIRKKTQTEFRSQIKNAVESFSNRLRKKEDTRHCKEALWNPTKCQERRENKKEWRVIVQKKLRVWLSKQMLFYWGGEEEKE